MWGNRQKWSPGRRRTLQWTLSSWFVAVAALACVAIGSLTYYVQSQNIREQMYDQLETLRDEKIASITTWISERLTVLELAAKRELLVRFFAAEDSAISREIIRADLLRMQAGYGFLSVFISDLNGNIVATTEVAKEVSWNLSLRRSYENRATTTRRVVVSDAMNSPAHGRPTILAVSPVFTPSTFEVVGTLAVLLDLEDDLFPRLDSAYLGRTGEILLINSEGLSQSPLMYRENAVADAKLVAEPAVRGSAGETGRITTNDYRPEPVMAAYGYINKLGWGIVAKQDMTEINIPVLQLTRNILLTTMAVLTMTIFVGSGIARSISAPAAEIAVASLRIGKGELEVEVPTHGPAELRTISLALRRMTGLLGKQRRYQQVTSEIYSAAGRHTSLNLLLDEVLLSLLKATRAQSGVIYYRAQGESDVFDRVLVQGTKSNNLPMRIGLSPPDHWLSICAVEAEVRVLAAPEDNDLAVSVMAPGAVPQALMSIPLMLHGRAICVIGLASLHAFTEDDEEVARSLKQNLGQYVELTVTTEATKGLASELDTRNRELEIMNTKLEDRSAELEEHASSLMQQAVELEAQRVRVEAADKMKSQFLSTMSHELRTPLSAVLSLSQIMIARGTGRNLEEEKEFLEVIERNGRDLLRLINDILDLSKIEAGGMEVTSSRFDPLAVIGQAIATVKPLVSEKSLTLKLEAGEIATIESDEAKLHQIILNLLSNAIKFTEQGTITVSVDYIGEELRISVEDTGMGIAAEELEAVFERFRQADGSNTRQHEGTGLGLAISRSLADLLGISLEVQSKVGVGSKFTLCIPHREALVLAESAECEVTKHAGLESQESTTRRQQGQPLILIAEDKPDNVLVLRSILEDIDCSIAVATTGRQAVDEARALKPDLVLMDIQMPVLSGEKAAVEMKSDPSIKSVPIIAITARAMRNDRETFLAAGCDDYLSKPIDPTALVTMIRRWI